MQVFLKCWQYSSLTVERLPDNGWALSLPKFAQI